MSTNNFKYENKKVKKVKWTSDLTPFRVDSFLSSTYFLILELRIINSWLIIKTSDFLIERDRRKYFAKMLYICLVVSEKQNAQ